MEQLKTATRRRIEIWLEALRRTLEETQIEEEKRRIERELAELEQVRSEVGYMETTQLERLHGRLGRDPADWIERRGA